MHTRARHATIAFDYHGDRPAFRTPSVALCAPPFPLRGEGERAHLIALGGKMAKTASRLVGLVGAVLAFLSPVAASAQGAPPATLAAPPAADPAMAAQKAAFDAMAETDRKAVQDALVWTGLYVGTVDGAFGKRTRDSILAWQTSVNAPATGALDAAQLAALKALLVKERAAVGFQTFIDVRTGVSIGAPLKILDKRGQNGADSALSRADGSVTLMLHSNAGTETDFATLYAQIAAERPGRKIAYKALKPDAFFVVSGEEAGRKFYTRIAKAAATSPEPTARRGFTFSYPAAQSAAFDRIALGIANSFEPFPTATPAAANAPGSVPVPAPSPTPAAAPAPSGPMLTATGLIVAPGQAVSALGAADCAAPTIDGKAAKFLREDRESGLSLFGGEFGAGAVPPPLGAIGPDMVALSFEQRKPGAPSLIVAPASPLAAEGGTQILAPLPKSGAGSPLFDRNGDLAGLVARGAVEPKKVAGISAAAPHRAVDAGALRGFVALEPASGNSKGQPLGAGQVAAARRGAVVAIYCAR